MSNELLNKILFKLKKKVPFSVIVQELDLNQEDSIYVLEVLRNKGYSLEEKLNPTKEESSHYFINSKKRHYKICLLSDTHLGSENDRISVLEAVYESGDKRGIDYYLHAGDLFEGMLFNSPQYINSLKCASVKEQIEYAASKYPKSLKPTLVINGNHEEATYKQTNIDLLRELTKLRSDIIYLQNSKSNLQIGKLRVMMVHGLTTNRRHKENQIKKDIDLYPRGSVPDLVVTGHTHNRTYSKYKGVHIFQVPSLMTCRDPKIYNDYVEENGVWWLELEINSQGNIERMIQEPESFSQSYVKKI